MKLQLPQSISNSDNIQDLIRFTSSSLDRIKAIVNGNVDLVDNGNNELLSVTFNQINTDVQVNHSLGRVPRGYFNAGSNNTLLSLKNGNASNTSSTLFLQSGSTGTVTVMVF